MESIQIIGNGKYLPLKRVTNHDFAKQFHVTEDYIYKRTGIKERYYAAGETIEQMATLAVRDLLKSIVFDVQKIDMIIVATTTTQTLMPGVSYMIQKELDIKECMCFDILAGCNGYVNAIDIARNYLLTSSKQYALVIGAEILSHYINQTDINTALLLSDGAGATLIGKTTEKKQYASYIQSQGQKGDILTCQANCKLQMDGREIYRYAVKQTVENIKTLLEDNKQALEQITYIIPHQSNIRIIQAIANRLKIEKNKMYTNIDRVGNTFCASIPIALAEIQEKKLLKAGDKILLLGYGGGLNTGSIIMEV